MKYVVDASIAIKWFVQENLHRESVSLLERQYDLYAPELIVSEVTNIAWKKVLRGEVSLTQAQDIVATIRSGTPKLIPAKAINERAFEIATTIEHPAYDCFYIACAELIDGVLITADEGIIKATEGTNFYFKIAHVLDIYYSPSYPIPPLLLSDSYIEMIIHAAENFNIKEEELDPLIYTDTEAPQASSVVSAWEQASSDQKHIIEKRISSVRSEVYHRIDDLSQEEKIDILTLVLLGQGQEKSWEKARSKAKGLISNNSLEHLVHMPDLGKELRQGFAVVRDMRNQPG